MVFKYVFKENYVRGKRLQGRDNWSGPRYSVALWNHYETVLAGETRTNNSSEGWHTSFATLVGSSHPPLYKFLVSLQKEQNSTEGTLKRMDIGQRVRRDGAILWREREARMKNIVERYDQFEGREIEYLDRLSHYVHM